MEAHRRSLALGCGGLLLIVAGFALFVLSYFLLPLYVTTLNCFDSCSPPKSATAWEFSLNVLSRFSITPPVSAGILVLLYLPPLAAVLVVGCALVFLVHPRRALATWLRINWLAGGIALGILVFLLLVWVRPDAGYLGMLLGYGLFWGGRRLLVTAYP